jgi:uncharacterized membrane protein YGL010W
MSDHCLNCHHPLTNKFCPNCGQKATTHRFSLKRFLLHDFIHGVFSIDRGFLYTVGQLFTRPGHSIREYVEGKRAQHFSFFAFIVLVITLGHLIGSYFNVSMVDALYYSSDGGVVTELEKFYKESPKLFKLSQIPFFALFSWLIFKKSKQNFTEHLVLNSYKVSAEIMLLVALSLLAYFFRDVLSPSHVQGSIAIVLLLYSTLFYYQYFSRFGYSKAGLLLRSVLASIVINVLIAAITTFFVGMKQGFEDPSN